MHLERLRRSLTDAGARRVAVANLELRVPVVGALGVLRESGPLPIDAFVFADAGWFDSGAAPRRTARCCAAPAPGRG